MAEQELFIIGQKPDDIILMLLIYKKNEQEDLTDGQTKILKKIVDEEFK